MIKLFQLLLVNLLLCSNSFGTPVIPDHSVLQRKLAPRTYTLTTGGTGGVVLSSSIATSVSSTGLVPGSSVTITTTGRPVMVMLCSDNLSFHQGYVGLSGGNAGDFQFYRGAGVIGGSFHIEFPTALTGPFKIPPSASFIDPVPAGTYTYQLFATPSSNTMLFQNVQLVVYEL